MKIVEDPTKLINVEITISQKEAGYSYYLRLPYLNRILEKDFDISTDYFFIRTVANNAAIESITKRNLESKKDMRVVRSYDKILMEVYLNTLEFLTHTKHYPLIANEGYHSWPHYEQHIWPVIHVIKKEDYSNFLRVTNSLNKDEAYTHIKSTQAPQNYQMQEIDFLRKKEIEPLKLEDRIWKVDAKTLRNAIDFLCQFGYVSDYSRSTIEED